MKPAEQDVFSFQPNTRIRPSPFFEAVLIDAAVPVGTEVTLARANGLTTAKLVEIPFL